MPGRCVCGLQVGAFCPKSMVALCVPTFVLPRRCGREVGMSSDRQPQARRAGPRPQRLLCFPPNEAGLTSATNELQWQVINARGQRRWPCPVPALSERSWRSRFVSLKEAARQVRALSPRRRSLPSPFGRRFVSALIPSPSPGMPTGLCWEPVSRPVATSNGCLGAN